jgi:hypothetical protein
VGFARRGGHHHLPRAGLRGRRHCAHDEGWVSRQEVLAAVRGRVAARVTRASDAYPVLKRLSERGATYAQVLGVTKGHVSRAAAAETAAAIHDGRPWAEVLWTDGW